jgi:hypothetical protein
MTATIHDEVNGTIANRPLSRLLMYTNSTPNCRLAGQNNHLAEYYLTVTLSLERGGEVGLSGCIARKRCSRYTRIPLKDPSYQTEGQPGEEQMEYEDFARANNNSAHSLSDCFRNLQGH